MSGINDWQEVPDGHINDWQEAPTQQDQGQSGFQKAWNYNPSEQQRMEAAKHPITGMEDPAYQLAGLVSPSSAISGLRNLLGKGVKSAGDYLMRRSIGAVTEGPGFGQSLADQGLIGTKSMMAKQAEQGLQTSGQQIGGLAAKIPGKIAQSPVADRIGSLATNKMTSSGIVPPEEVKDVGQILGKAREVSQSAPVSGSDMAELRAIAGRRANQMGAYRQVPSAALKSQLASAEQAGRSQALKEAYSAAFPGDGALADADKTYSTLSTANKYLSKPDSQLLDSIQQSTLTGNLGKLIPGSLLNSTAGRAAIGTGNIIQRTPVGAVPLTLQQLLGKDSN